MVANLDAAATDVVSSRGHLPWSPHWAWDGCGVCRVCGTWSWSPGPAGVSTNWALLDGSSFLWSELRVLRYCASQSALKGGGVNTYVNDEDGRASCWHLWGEPMAFLFIVAYPEVSCRLVLLRTTRGAGVRGRGQVGGRCGAGSVGSGGSEDTGGVGGREGVWGAPPQTPRDQLHLRPFSLNGSFPADTPGGEIGLCPGPSGLGVVGPGSVGAAA